MKERKIRLRHELERSRVRYAKAIAGYRSAYGVFNDLGGKDSDSKGALKAANTSLSTATTEFQSALERCSAAEVAPPRLDSAAEGRKMTGSNSAALESENRRLILQGRRLKIEFLEAEIQTSVTLATVSKTHRVLGYPESADRSMASARQGYSVAARMLGELTDIDPELRQTLSARLDFLRRQLDLDNINDFGLEHVLLQTPSVQLSDPPESPLSKRETEVLRMIVHGKSTKEIASELNISFRTAVCHRANAMRKLGVPNAAALVRKATLEHLV